MAPLGVRRRETISAEALFMSGQRNKGPAAIGRQPDAHHGPGHQHPGLHNRPDPFSMQPSTTSVVGRKTSHQTNQSMKDMLRSKTMSLDTKRKTFGNALSITSQGTNAKRGMSPHQLLQSSRNSTDNSKKFGVLTLSGQSDNTEASENSTTNSSMSERRSYASSASHRMSKKLKGAPKEVRIAHNDIRTSQVRKLSDAGSEEVGSPSTIQRSHGLIASSDEEMAWIMVLGGGKGIDFTRRLCLKICLSSLFDSLIALVVVANAITMALESEMPQSKDELQTTELIFLGIYSFELFIRVHVFRRIFFTTRMNWLDVIVVLIGWLSDVIMPHILSRDNEGTGTDREVEEIGSTMSLLKLCRALRVIRFYRMVTFFDGLWMIVQSFFYCLRPLAWTCLFISVILFIFTIFTVELIGENPDFDGVPSQLLFRSTYPAFVTLFQLMTLDDWRSVLQPLFDRRGWTYIIFLFYICLAALGLMNLVTAVCVEGSLQQIQKDDQYQNQILTRDHMIEAAKIQELFEIFSVQTEGIGRHATLVQDPLSASTQANDQMKKTRSTGRQTNNTRQSSRSEFGADARASTFTAHGEGDGSIGEITVSRQESIGQKVVTPEDLIAVKGCWGALERILDTLDLDDSDDVRRLLELIDEDGSGDLTLDEVLHGMLHLRKITEDKHRLAIIRAAGSSSKDAKFSVLERCLASLPEANSSRVQEILADLETMDEELESQSWWKEVNRPRKSNAIKEGSDSKANHTLSDNGPERCCPGFQKAMDTIQELSSSLTGKFAQQKEALADLEVSFENLLAKGNGHPKPG